MRKSFYSHQGTILAKNSACKINNKKSQRGSLKNSVPPTKIAYRRHMVNFFQFSWPDTPMIRSWKYNFDPKHGLFDFFFRLQLYLYHQTGALYYRSIYIGTIREKETKKKKKFPSKSCLCAHIAIL